MQETRTIPAEIRQTLTASGNVVNVAQGGESLPDAPRTVEQVAKFLQVTPDTVRESYIPDWIDAGHMTAGDRAGQRWLIPPTFEPYRTR